MPVWPLVAWLVACSVVLFALMVMDKRRARRRGARIPERTLLFWATIGGAPGGQLAMALVRHKTRHLRFRVLMPILSLAWLLVAVTLHVRG